MSKLQQIIGLKEMELEEKDKEIQEKKKQRARGKNEKIGLANSPGKR